MRRTFTNHPVCRTPWMQSLARAVLVGLLGGYGFSLQAQLNFRPAPISSDTPAVQALPLDRGNGEFQITERGPHHQVWERVETVMDEQGQPQERVRSYTEMGGNLNYWDPVRGEWVAGEAVIEPTRGGAIARKGAQQVKFPGKLNVRGGIRIQNSDGQSLSSTILGLVYRHGTSGRQVAIASLKHSRGELLPPNRVIYRDAFDNVRADVLYEYKLTGVVQDVVLREKVPPPTAFGFASSEGVSLEVVSEWFTDREPEVKQRTREGRGFQRGPRVKDDEIRFGSMTFGAGVGFATQTENPLIDSFDVTKRWVAGNNRKLLYESVRLLDVESVLSQLPNRVATPSQRPAADVGALPQQFQELPAPVLSLPDSNGAPLPEGRDDVKSSPGLTIDYVTIDQNADRTNVRFESGKTYKIVGNHLLHGKTVFEGGAVIKHGNFSLLNVTSNGSVEFLSTPFNPVIFTSYHDETVGEDVEGSLGDVPPAIHEGTAFYAQDVDQVLVQNAVFRYCDYGVFLRRGWGHRIRNIRVYHADKAVGVTQTPDTTWVENALFDDFRLGLNNATGELAAANLTAHNGGTMATLAGAEFRNSLFVNVRTLHPYVGQGDPHNVVEPSAAGVFQTAGGGSFYLAAGSPHRNQGTDRIHPALKYELERMTTFPPTVLDAPGGFTSEVTWTPHVLRDNDGTFDIGYHYPAVDYLIRSVVMDNQGVLTVEAGTNLGIYGDRGVFFYDDTEVHFKGTVTEPIQICWYGDVQDGTDPARVGRWSNQIFSVGDRTPVGTQSVLHLDFVHVYPGSFVTGEKYFLRAWTGRRCHDLRVRHSVIDGQAILIDAGAEDTHQWINNRFHDRQVTIHGSHSLEVSNNLFHGSRVRLFQNSGTNVGWFVRENVFHSLESSSADHLTNVLLRSNAYVDTSRRFGGQLYPGDLVLSASSVPFTTGPFGDYYIDSTSNSPLFNAGSRPAPDAGLFHFSTRWPNDLKEGTSTVDIGLHYPSTIPGHGDSGN